MDIKLEQFSKEQNEVLEKFKQGDNVFITGPGGTGKTALIKHLFEHAKSEEKKVQVCALTGCAAVLLGCEGAKTLHSWAGIGLASGGTLEITDKVINSSYKSKIWKKTDVLIVDEVSMMSKKLFDLLNYIGKRTRRTPNLSFGGIQLVFSGDFYQLPPVGSQEQIETTEFCFESVDWNITFPTVVELKTIFRQSDKLYCKVLNQIRVGRLSKSSFNALQSRVKKYDVDISCKSDSGIDSSKNNIRPTILMARRKDVECINNRELTLLEGVPHTYQLRRADDLPVVDRKQGIPSIPKTQYTNEWQYLENNIIADKTLVLKEGTQVMCVANIDMEGPFPIVNGSQGIVVSFKKGLPMVKFNDGQTRLIGEHTWASENCPKIGIKQIPLIHAWAITIHKAQGATLDLVELDAGNSIFECGQTYVALSRVKSLEGLYLRAFDPQKIKIHKKVQQFYKTIA